jgi:hypothetical protein
VDAVHEARAERDALAARMLDEIERFLAPLRRLNDGDRLAVVAVVAAAELLTVCDRSRARSCGAIGDRFDRLLGTLHLEGSRLSGDVRTACLAEPPACSDGEAVAEMECLVMQLEGMVGALTQLRPPAAA